MDASWTAPNRTVVDGDLDGLAALVTQGRDELRCDGVCLHLLSTRRDAILLQVVSSGYVAGRTTQRMPLDRCPAVSRCMFDDEVIAVNDAIADPSVARRAIEVFKIKACVYAPLHLDGVPVGILIASRRESHRWTAVEIAAVGALAGRAELSLVRPIRSGVRVSG